MGDQDRQVTGVDELARAVRVLGYINTTCLEGFSAVEVLNIVAAAVASEWDMLIDEWQDAQLLHAAHLGAEGAPRFVEQRSGVICAVRVRCAHCDARRTGGAR